MRPPDTTGYGRLAFGSQGLDAIVEERHADEALRRDGLCNAGIMVIERARLDSLLGALEPKQPKNEYYLTDIVEHARTFGWRCTAIEGPWLEGVGVNSQAQLADAEALLQGRLRAGGDGSWARRWSAPETVFFACDTVLAPGVEVGPYVVFGPDVEVAEGAQILPFCHLEGVRIGPARRIGPFARLRPGAEIGEGAHIGNFVEVKNARLEAGAKANHLSYVGDARVGAALQHRRRHDHLQLRRLRQVPDRDRRAASSSARTPPWSRRSRSATAPSSAPAARSIDDVPPDSLSIARARQTDIPDGAARFRARKSRRST